jgi:hypothetical protein
MKVTTGLLGAVLLLGFLFPAAKADSDRVGVCLLCSLLIPARKAHG